MPPVEVPPEDGALARALADADAKLTEWLAAVETTLHFVQSHADAGAEAPTSLQAEVAEPSAEAVSEASPPEGSVAGDVGAAEPPDVLPVEDETAVPETPAQVETASVEAPAGDEAVVPEAPADATETVAEAVAESAAAASADAVPPDQPDQASETEPLDDEQLLASLDEQTQAAVRVRRRLYGNGKSIRELIDEVQRAPMPNETNKPEPKRWWRRR